MAAFGTVKPGFAQAAELQFPQVFSRAYGAMGGGEEYAPSRSSPFKKQDYVGDQFQANYHAQKRADAQRSVLNGVADTRRSVNRAMVSHAGYYGLPEVVRSQRRIGSDVGTHVGANIYYGAGVSNAMPVAGLEGGIIGSREGRQYVKNALVRRRAQLDALDMSAMEGPTIQAQVDTKAGDAITDAMQLSLRANLDAFVAMALGYGTAVAQAAEESGMGGRVPTGSLRDRADMVDRMSRLAMSLLQYFSLPDSAGQLDDVVTVLTDVGFQLRNILTTRDPEAGTRGNAVTDEQTMRLFAFVESALKFLKGMDELPDLPARERKIRAQSLFKSSGMTKLFVSDLSKTMRAIAESEPALLPEADNIDDFLGGPGGDDDDEDDDDGTGPGGRGRSRLARQSFTRNATNAEISSGPSLLLPRSALRDENLENFALQGQPGEMRALRAYKGESTLQPTVDYSLSTNSGAVPLGLERLKRDVDEEGMEADEDYAPRSNAASSLLSSASFEPKAFPPLPTSSLVPSSSLEKPRGPIRSASYEAVQGIDLAEMAPASEDAARRLKGATYFDPVNQVTYVNLDMTQPGRDFVASNFTADFAGEAGDAARSRMAAVAGELNIPSQGFLIDSANKREHQADILRWKKNSPFSGDDSDLAIAKAAVALKAAERGEELPQKEFDKRVASMATVIPKAIRIVQRSLNVLNPSGFQRVLRPYRGEAVDPRVLFLQPTGPRSASTIVMDTKKKSASKKK